VSREAVLAEVRQWVGTPYHPHGRLPGVGVDCANLLCCVYEGAGVVPEVQPGFYDVGWHLHRNAEVFLDWMERVGARQTTDPQPGDCGVWQFGRTYSHGGILTEPGLVAHAYLGRGVIESRITEEPLLGRPVHWFTLWSS
jgi:cell wall-associated NlpC family hydrolase